MIQTLRVFALHNHSLAVGMCFFTLSLLMGTWVARIPDVQLRTNLSDGQLGLSMLGLSFGALVSTFLSGWILNQLSVHRAVLWSGILFCLSIIAPAFAYDQWSLLLALAVLGAANGFMNVSVNAAAAAIEKHTRLSIMSACHGMFSVGGVIGAASSGWIASTGLALPWHFIAMALLTIGLQLALRPILRQLPDTTNTSTRLALPTKSKALLLLAFISFCVILCEGAIADWSAVYLRKNLGSDAFLAGLGYAGFCLTMALGRFSGDVIRTQWGTVRTIRGGALIGAAGLLLLVTATHPIAGVLCFVLVGIGLSTIVPTVFGAAAKTPYVQPSIGLASVATAGILGLLTGRLLVGNISDWLGLQVALAFTAVLVLLAAGVAGKIKVSE